MKKQNLFGEMVKKAGAKAAVIINKIILLYFFIFNNIYKL